VIPPSPEDQEAYEDAQSDYQSRLDSYYAQQRAQAQDFNARQNAYEQSRENYETQRQTFETQQDIYEDQAQDYADLTDDVFDNETIDARDVVRLERLETFADDGAAIAGSPVRDRFGRNIGNFRYVRFDNNGLPHAVIALSGLRRIQVPAEDLRYDPDRDIVLADLSYAELERMPRG
jgi:hypothetical protein